MKYTTVAAFFAAVVLSTSVASASPLRPRQEASSAAPQSASSSSSRSRTRSSTTRTSSSSTSSSASTSTSTGSSSGYFNSSSDVDILKYALTLEHLEAAFYNASLGMFSEADFEAAGVNGSYRDQVYSIGRDEASHVSLLTAALGNDTLQPCTYNLSTVTDVPSFFATARLLEGVGISAYLGAAGAIVNQTYLTIAGAILTVEARHQSALNAIVSAPNWVPSAYDTPLNFSGVYTLAAPYIESCPTDLGLTAFPTLTLSSTNTSQANGNSSTAAALPNAFSLGDEITVTMENSTSNSSSSNNATYIALISGVVATTFLPLGDNMTFTLPNNMLGGQFYAVLTSSNTTVTDDTTLAGPAIGYVNIALPKAPAPTASASSVSSSSSSASLASSASTAISSISSAASSAGDGISTIASSATVAIDSFLSSAASATTTV